MPAAWSYGSVSIAAANYEVRSRSDAGGATRSFWGAADTETSELDTALLAAEFEIVEDVDLAPVAGVGLRAAVEDRAISISVEAAADESAVVLVEDASGLLSWRTPDALPMSAATRAGSGTLQFTILPPSAPADEPEQRRGIFGEKIFELIAEPIRVRVLKFLATKTTEAAVARIEGALVPGPVVVTPGDPSTWTTANYAAMLPRDLPADRPWRVLLLVHGTFSSTIGSFGHLGGTTMLAQAHEAYDLILGYDHKTLSEAPEANAQAILGALRALNPPAGSTIDAVSYSRGGLVLRVLVEQLAPVSSLRARFDKSVFVGCTNAGTKLAEPENWATLIDVYTNAVSAGLQIGGAVTGLGWATPIAGYAIQTLGKFVQMLATVAISERQLPGLAAMEPDSDLINTLNSAHAPAAAPAYYAITANFDTAADADAFPRRAALALANRVVDRLMGEANDLVVNTNSMTHFGIGQTVTAKEALDPADHVFHTSYFAQTVVHDRLAEWLKVEVVRAAAPERTPEVDRGGEAGIGAAKMDTRGGFSFETDSGGQRAEPPSRNAEWFSNVDGAADDGATRAWPGGADDGSAAALPEPEAASAPADVPEPASPAASALDTSRYIAAEMTPFPKLGPPANVYVTVSPDVIAVADHAAAAVTPGAVPLARAKPLTLVILATRNCQVVGPDTYDVDLHVDEEELRKFKVRGLAVGDAELVVEARQGMQTVASFTLRPVFVADAAAPLRSTSAIVAPLAETTGQMVLRIYETPNPNSGLHLIFNLNGDNPATGVVEELDIPGFDARTYTSDVIKQIEQAAIAPGEGGTTDIYDAFLEALVSDAQVRTDALIPEKIRRELWRNRKAIKAVQVISNEPSIPWELMYLSDPDGQEKDPERGFLAEWGLIRWLHDAPLRRRRVPTSTGTKALVVPDYTNPRWVLKGAAEERGMLKARFPDIVDLEAKSSAMRRWLASSASNCAVLHFACHGGTKQAGVVESKLLMEALIKENGQEYEDVLTWQDVTTCADFGPEGGPLVFVNACQTGQAGSAFGGMAGFADAFLSPKSRRGAAAFIGALWSISDTLANRFANDVYTRLDAGESLADAVREARKECQTKKDFTWLAYTVYGPL